MDNGTESAKEVPLLRLIKKAFDIISLNLEIAEMIQPILSSKCHCRRDGKIEVWNMVFHPAEHNLPWIGGHASPGPLFSKNSLIWVKENYGVINGREANQIIAGKTKYGMFLSGCLFMIMKRKIDWVSPKPFIQDSEALTITFASQFVETKPGEGILYAHVDDSFVRAYTLKAEFIKPYFQKYDNGFS